MSETDRSKDSETGQHAPRSRKGGKQRDGSGSHLAVVSGTEPKLSRTRVQIEVTDVTLDTLNRLVRETNLGSPSQVVRVALQLLDDLLRDQRAGASIVIVKDGQQPERLRLVF